MYQVIEVKDQKKKIEVKDQKKKFMCYSRKLGQAKFSVIGEVLSESVMIWISIREICLKFSWNFFFLGEENYLETWSSELAQKFSFWISWLFNCYWYKNEN